MIYKLPDGWDWYKIKDICHIGRGRVISKEEIQKHPGVYPVYSSQTYNEGVFGNISSYDFDGEYVTWTTDGANAGTVFYRNGKFNCTNVCGTLKAKNNNINMKLLSLILNNFTKSEVFIASGNPKLMNNVMAKIKIPFPINADEQKRIVKIIKTKLKFVEKVIKYIEEQYITINYLFDSYLREVYHSIKEHKILGDVTKINPSIGKIKNNDIDTDVSFIPMTAVNAETGNIETPEIRKYSVVRKGYTYFENNDVIFAKITPCMQNGKHAIARNLINGYGFGSTEFHVIRPSNEVLPEWIHYFLRQSNYLKLAENYMQGSVGQQRLPDDYLSKTVIPLPPIKEQEKHISILNRKNTQIKAFKNKIIEQQSYINAMPISILRQAFEGKL